MTYRFHVTMNPPSYTWQPYGTAWTPLPEVHEVEGELIEVDDNGHLLITDAAGQIVFAVANGGWLSCHLADEPQTVGAKVGSVTCEACGTEVPVEVNGPWSGSLDDQMAVAVRAATAQHPNHAGRVVVIDPSAARSAG